MAAAGAGVAGAFAIGIGVLFSSGSGGSIDIFVGSTPTPVGGGGGLTCDRNATTGTFAAQVTASTAGQTICLAAGSYGTWAGANKAITITRQAGVALSAVTMAINFDCGAGCGTSNVNGVTVDGLTITSGDIVGDNVSYATTHSSTQPRNVTIRNSNVTGEFVIDGVFNANILLEHNNHNNINCVGSGSCSPAKRINLAYDNDPAPSGVTIQYSEFDGGDADGVGYGVGVTIQYNEFQNIIDREPDSTFPNHTDPIQCGGDCHNGTVIRGNYLHGNTDGITAFDRLYDATIEDNVAGTAPDTDCIDLYSAHNVTVQHNTCASGMDIYFDHKSADPVSDSNIVRNNVAPGGVDLTDGSCCPTNTKNLFSGATGTNINGSPTFVGGGSPSSMLGYLLTAGSAGHLAATDGLDVGTRVNTTITYGPLT